jgi:hypothetical protein
MCDKGARKIERAQLWKRDDGDDFDRSGKCEKQEPAPVIEGWPLQRILSDELASLELSWAERPGNPENDAAAG